MDDVKRRLKIYRNKKGKEPFTQWLDSLDQSARYRIISRLDRVQLGNFGDCHSVGEEVMELRFHFGAGYRVYFGEVGKEIILLLAGGAKASQRKDIKKAYQYWREYKEVK
jgi:putative addiction module killer protein